MKGTAESIKRERERETFTTIVDQHFSGSTLSLCSMCVCSVQWTGKQSFERVVVTAAAESAASQSDSDASISHQ